MKRWADLWHRMIQRLAHWTRAASRSEASLSTPEEDELARLIRWSLQSTIGRHNPPAVVWWRIRDELLAPARPLSRRWVHHLAGVVDFSRLVQGAVTIALLVFVFTSVLQQPLSPWSIRPSGMTPTPGWAASMRTSSGATEGLLNGAHVFQLQQTRGHRERGYRDADYAGIPEVIRLNRVRDVAALGFVPVSEHNRRVLINPTEDVLISELSKDVLAEAREDGQAQADAALAGQVAGFRFGVIPSGYQFD